MEAIRVTTAIHQSAGKFINNNYFAILDDIVTVSFHHGLRTQGLNEEMV